MAKRTTGPSEAGRRPASPSRTTAPAAAPAGAAPTRTATSSAAASGGGDVKKLGSIKGRLSAQRERLLEQLREIEEATSDVAQADSDEVSFDEDSADAGTSTFEREKDLSIAHNVRDLAGKTARALDKIEAGTYGICESCGKPIEPARLRALPHVLLCLACKKAEERR